MRKLTCTWKLAAAAEEFREEVQTALNSAIEKLASDNETAHHTFGEEVATLKEENRYLREELDQVLGKLSEVVDELALVKKVVVQGNTSSPSTYVGMLATAQRMEVPKPSSFKGSRNAKEIENFLWIMEHYFRAMGIIDEGVKVDNATLNTVLG